MLEAAGPSREGSKDISSMDSKTRMRRMDGLLYSDEEDEASQPDRHYGEDKDDSRTTRIIKSSSRKRKLSPSSSASDGPTDEEPFEDAQDTDEADSVSSDKEGSSPTLPKLTTPSTRQNRPPAAPQPTSKRGVIYVSRIPPYLKPHTLRQMISVHGPVTNLFLTPEPPTVYHHRVRTHHGNKKRQYIDGWVEFRHRRHARACVDALNGRTTAEGLGVGAIGGRKGGKGRWYRDDVWSVKYLKGFSWDDLMQSARIEEREREERIRLGLVKEKKERQTFLDGVQHAKIEKTRAAKRKRKAEAGDEGEGASASQTVMDQAVGTGFRQKEPIHRGGKGFGETGNVHRVLSKIF